MCPQCEGYAEKTRLDHSRDYFNLMHQLKDLVNEGVFLVSGNCSLDTIKEGEPFPYDFLEHTFTCSHCKQVFKISVENYLGSGGHWQVKVNYSCEQ